MIIPRLSAEEIIARAARKRREFWTDVLYWAIAAVVLYAVVWGILAL